MAATHRRDSDDVQDRVSAASYTPALDVVASYLRRVGAWPEGRGPVAGFLGKYVLPYSFFSTLLPPMVYFGLGEHSHNTEFFGFLADALGSSLCLVKMVNLAMHSSTIIEVREFLKGFAPLERWVSAEAAELNERCERRGGILARRYVRIYSSVTVTGWFGMAVSILRNDPDTRWLPVKCPGVIMQSTPLYLAMAFVSAVELYVFPIAIGIFDSLVIILCLHIACKCDVLVVMLGRAVRDEDPAAESQDGADDSYERLRRCAVYHQSISRLHQKVESMLSTIALFQMFYTLVGLGTPLFRLMGEKQEFHLHDLMFSVVYVGWTFCQLFTYCYFGDIVAQSSGRLLGASYESFHPTLTSRDARLGSVQRMLPLFAKKPLFITAGSIAKLTLRLFQDIMKRSYSLYSTVLRMR